MERLSIVDCLYCLFRTSIESWVHWEDPRREGGIKIPSRRVLLELAVQIEEDRKNEFSDYRMLGWVGTRILELMVNNMDPDQLDWDTPWSRGYAVSSPPGRLVGISTFRRLGIKSNSPVSPFGQDGTGPAENTAIVFNETGTGNDSVARSFEVSSKRAHDILVHLNLCNRAILPSYKPVLLLLIEYVYKVVFATDYKAAITEALGRQPVAYQSEEMWGLTLMVSYVGGTSIRERFTMEDIAIVVSSLVLELGNFGQWKPFTAEAKSKKDPDAKFLKIVLTQQKTFGTNDSRGNITIVA